mmetsp:Transcript_11874/g.21703  ORF Transcript_11874/g.21703 Transcript_11874/m.21703 type:complete len:351 (-) Transcript_11874:124-1176(-)
MVANSPLPLVQHLLANMLRWPREYLQHIWRIVRLRLGLPVSHADQLQVDCSKRFAWNDPVMISYLDEHGYVVVRDALTETDLRQAEDMLFNFMSSEAGWDRSDPATWTDASFSSMGNAVLGLVNRRGAGQSDLSWFVRTRHAVFGTFRQLWQTDELLTSFDGLNIFRPWHKHDFLKTEGNWYHVDQGRSKVGRHAVQGLVTLYDQDASTGGLVVIPGSHHRHQEVLRYAKDDADFVVPGDSSSVMSMPKRLVTSRAGDLILWDSRTVHCNTPAVSTPTAPGSRLLRACVYVCMTPKAWADKRTLEDRRKGYEIRVTTSHWPHTSVMGLGWGRPGPLAYEDADQDRRKLIC